MTASGRLVMLGELDEIPALRGQCCAVIVIDRSALSPELFAALGVEQGVTLATPAPDETERPPDLGEVEPLP